MPAALADNQIIQEVLQGNQQAYAGLVDRYKDYVFTLAFRLLKNREDAEEVAQDAFVKAYRYLSDFRGDSKFSTWLYTIVNNTAISHLRKKRPENFSLDQDRVFESADNLVSAFRADQVEKKSRQESVNRAIGLLNPDDAQVITLFYKAEQTLEELARILGVEANTAKVRLHRARLRLREILQTHFAAEINDVN